MRIAYIAPYQGPALVRRRPVVQNLRLAGRVKMQRIAELLQSNGHEVEIFSQGEVIELQLKIFPGFTDPEPFHPKIPVYYSSAFPVRFLNGLWSGLTLLHIFRARNRVAPFDVVLLYNLKAAQVMCARYAIKRLGLPIILEYEDNAFVDRAGKREAGLTAEFYLLLAKRLLKSISACVAVSPELLSQTPASIPKLMLRGIVGEEIVKGAKRVTDSRKNWVVFSGTLGRTYGLENLIKAWEMLNLPDWELHIAGDGELRDRLHRLAADVHGIVLDGLLNRDQNAALLCSAKIGVNPHDSTAISGNIFAFKIVEYLAAGTHVLTARMGGLPAELEKAVTYLSDNTPAVIAATLRQLIERRCYERTASEPTLQMYGPDAVGKSLNELISTVTDRHNTGRGKSNLASQVRLEPCSE